MGIVLAVFKMDSETGQITQVAKHPVSQRSPLLINNGNWFGMLDDSNELLMFRLDDNYQVINVTTRTLAASALQLLPDDSIVYYDTGLISMTRYNGDKWVDYDWSVHTYMENNGVFLSMWADNNTLIFRNSTAQVLFYTRADDGTWTYAEEFEANRTEASYMVYNGVDTLFFVNALGLYGSATSLGYIEIYTRQDNGEWTEQIIIGGDITDGFVQSAIGYYSLSLINKDTLAVGAPLDGYQSGSGKRGISIGVDYPIGSMRILRRQENKQWTLVAQSELSTPGSFAATTIRTSTHLVTTFGNTLLTNSSGTPTMFYSFPLCFFEPVDVTCSDVETDTCQFNLTSGAGYTINSDPECGAYSFSLAGYTNMTYSFDVTFRFDKVLAASATCNATFTCPLPVPVAHPVTSSTPVGGPASAPSQKVSVAACSEFGAAIILVLFAMF